MTMRERMARAIRERVMAEQGHPPFDELGDGSKEMWLQAADAALDALMLTDDEFTGAILNQMADAFTARGTPLERDYSGWLTGIPLSDGNIRVVRAFIKAAKAA